MPANVKKKVNPAARSAPAQTMNKSSATRKSSPPAAKSSAPKTATSSTKTSTAATPAASLIKKTSSTGTPVVAPAIVSPDHHSPPRATAKNNDAIDSSNKKRDRSLVDSSKDSPEAANGITSSSNKRRRQDVEIQRADTTKEGTKIPSPPSVDPPEPTKYMKVLVVGPATAGKTQWMTGIPTSPEATSSSPFAMNYSSKDYSFESSASVNETVRLHVFNVDCTAKDQPPASWNYSLLPSVHHVVLVLDLLSRSSDDKANEETLNLWKVWLDRNITFRRGTRYPQQTPPPVSLVFIDSSRYQSMETTESKYTLSEWNRLGSTVHKVCRNWPNVNKWYLMKKQESSSDVILQTLIERTWTTLGPKSETSKTNDAGATPESSSKIDSTNITKDLNSKGTKSVDPPASTDPVSTETPAVKKSEPAAMVKKTTEPAPTKAPVAKGAVTAAKTPVAKTTAPTKPLVNKAKTATTASAKRGVSSSPPGKTKGVAPKK